MDNGPFKNCERESMNGTYVNCQQVKNYQTAVSPQAICPYSLQCSGVNPLQLY